LSAGPTPHPPLEKWTFAITQEGGPSKSWSWTELRALPTENVTADIHCVTRWSKLDTEWQAVSLDTLLAQVEHDAAYVMAFSDGGYTTNLPLADVTGARAWVAFGYAGGALPGRPRAEPAATTVERLGDGEVSPSLTEELRVGDDLELRGPIGGYFVWDADPHG